MAELDKQMFGNIKGKFGKAVFRQRNGINYIAQRPSNYTPPETDEFYERTGKFRIVSKIASVINSNTVLKEIWSTVTPKNLSIYNYLISKNYSAISNEQITGLVKITPDSLIGVRLDNAELTVDKLAISLLPFTSASGINADIEKKVKVISLLYLNNPVSADSPRFDVVLLESTAKTFDLDTGVNFEIFLSTSFKDRIALYQNKSIHSTILTYLETDEIQNYSSTFSYNFS